jgi:uncharacterized protein YcbK (DUF882 family)
VSGWPWPHFSRAELACKHCGLVQVEPVFLDRLEELRRTIGVPLVVTSGTRCPEYNARVSTTGLAGPHTSGRAVDLAVQGETAWRVLAAALELGFTGIGVKQHGPAAARFLHLDDLGRGRPRVWSYP